MARRVDRVVAATVVAPCESLSISSPDTSRWQRTASVLRLIEGGHPGRVVSRSACWLSVGVA